MLFSLYKAGSLLDSEIFVNQGDTTFSLRRCVDFFVPFCSLDICMYLVTFQVTEVLYGEPDDISAFRLSTRINIMNLMHPYCFRDDNNDMECPHCAVPGNVPYHNMWQGRFGEEKFVMLNIRFVSYCILPSCILDNGNNAVYHASCH